jgi:hypothetical protein
MDASSLQQVFKDRHILVLNTPSEVQEFNLESLCKLGSLNRVRQVQGGQILPILHLLNRLLPDIQLREKEGPHECLRGGTLIEYYEESLKRDAGRILSILDTPMGAVDVPNTMQYT